MLMMNNNKLKSHMYFLIYCACYMNQHLSLTVLHVNRTVSRATHFNSVLNFFCTLSVFVYFVAKVLVIVFFLLLLSIYRYLIEENTITLGILLNNINVLYSVDCQTIESENNVEFYL